MSQFAKGARKRLGKAFFVNRARAILARGRRWKQDGDIHIALQDANGNNAGTVSAEIPVGSKWCEIRQIVFGWTTQKFSIHGQDGAHV